MIPVLPLDALLFLFLIVVSVQTLGGVNLLPLGAALLPLIKVGADLLPLGGVDLLPVGGAGAALLPLGRLVISKCHFYSLLFHLR